MFLVLLEREREIGVDRRTATAACTFGGKKSAIEIDSSIWREEIGNRQ